MRQQSTVFVVNVPNRCLRSESTISQIRRPNPLVLKVIEEEAWDWFTFSQQARSAGAR